MTDIILEQEIAKKSVEEILKNDLRARNDDLWLILKYWQNKQLIKLFVPYEQLNVMTKPETITRVRRTIQNTEGKYLPTDPTVLIRRKVKQEILTKYYGEKSNIFKEWQNLKYEVK